MTDDGGQKTEDRIGKPGNQGNRVQVSRITGNQDAGDQQAKESGCSQLVRQLSRILYKSALFLQNKANFSEAQMNASSVFTKDYENKPAFRTRESKANQTQFVFLTAENAEYTEKTNICVSDCPIEKYALYPISPCSLRTRRLMKNKANFEPC